MAIARIGLARSLPRVLALPGALLATAAAAAIAGLLVPEAVAIGLWVVAALLVVAAAGLAVVPLTLRLEIEVGGLRLRWLFGARRFRLVPGAVTRASMGGGNGAIRSRLNVLGWAYGRAVLRGEERIVMVRLAPTPTMILVPTETGRLAIAARSEPELLEGLAAAARVQQRLDEVSGRVLAALPAPEPAAEAAAAPAEVEPAPRVLTGIERTRLEAELAAARQAALEAAEAERRAITEARAAGEPQATGGVPMAAPVVPPDDLLADAPATRPNAARRRARGRWERPAWALPGRIHMLATVAWGLVPIVASLVAYLTIGGTVLAGQDPTSRLEVLALVACGPLTAVGVLAARTWWPRLAGLVTVSALMALVLLVRATSG